MLLVVNNLIEWLLDGNAKRLERILWTDKWISYVIDVNSNQCPYKRTLEEIDNALDEKAAQIIDYDPFERVIHEEELSNKEREVRDKAWNIIKGIVEVEPEIYIRNERRRLIKNAAGEFGVSELTVLNYLKRYWERGKTRNTLLPDYYLCGGRGKDKKAGDKKRGRPRRYIDTSGEQGINVDEKIKSIFKTSINRFYRTSAKNSLVLTYELMRKEYFSDDFKIENGIKMPILNDSNKAPTFRQFRYWFEKERDIKKEVSSRKSVSIYEKENRPIIGNSTSEAIGPGSIYQIDATVADIYLVSSFNKEWIIGRPVVYAVIDVFSRMIVGVYIGLEGPSWLGAAMALTNAACNKVTYCKEYGIEISKEEWPVHYLPETILGDRGEMEGRNVENLINALHIKIQNTAPYRPELKAVVEQYFRTINLKVKPFLPGTVNPDLKDRGDKDYKLDAKLNLNQFTKVIIKCVLFHNNKHYLKDYNKDEMMISDGIECIPLELWKWGIANRSGKLRSISEDIIKLNLMPTNEAIVTAKGIKFKDLYYSSRMTMKEKWFEKARSKGTWRIDICYDPRNMDYIYIKESSGKSFEKCFLLDYQTKYRNKSFDDVQYYLEEEKMHSKKVSEEELQSKVDLITEIQDIAKRAEDEYKAEGKTNASNSKRKKGISTNRKIEKAANRLKESFELEKVENNEMAEVISIDGSKEKDDNSNELVLLKKKQVEALKCLLQNKIGQSCRRNSPLLQQ